MLSAQDAGVRGRVAPTVLNSAAASLASSDKTPFASVHSGTSCKREDLPGPPVYSTRIMEQPRTMSAECRSRIKKACRRGGIDELREAYNGAISGRKDSYMIPSAEVQPVIRKIVQYHTAKLEAAMDGGDKDDLREAIQACQKEQIGQFPKKLADAEKQIEDMD